MHRITVLIQLCLVTAYLIFPATPWSQVYVCKDAAGRVACSEYTYA